MPFRSMSKAVFLETTKSMNLFNRSKKHPDFTVIVTVKITPQLFSTAYALLLTLGASTLTVILSESKPLDAVDASYPALPQQNPICIAHLS